MKDNNVQKKYTEKKLTFSYTPFLKAKRYILVQEHNVVQVDIMFTTHGECTKPICILLVWKQRPTTEILDSIEQFIGRNASRGKLNTYLYFYLSSFIRNYWWFQCILLTAHFWILKLFVTRIKGLTHHQDAPLDDDDDQSLSARDLWLRLIVLAESVDSALSTLGLKTWHSALSGTQGQMLFARVPNTTPVDCMIMKINECWVLVAEGDNCPNYGKQRLKCGQ